MKIKIKIKIRYVYLIVLTLAGFLLNACDKGGQKQAVDLETTEEPIAVNQTLSINQQGADIWWLSGGEILANCLQHARQLQQLGSDFLDDPDQKKLEQTQQSWQNLALAYRAFYAHHYIALSDSQAFNMLAEIDFRIAAWPIQPGSLDSFGSYLYSGLVHDVGNPLTMKNLLYLHGQVDSENATLGIFAIEYMLYGENNSRSVEDYLNQIHVSPEFKERGFNSISELPNNRRRMLLTLQTGKLVEDLELAVNSWNGTGTTTQFFAWNKLSDSQKSKVVSAALEQGLAQLLVEEDAEEKSEHLRVALESLRPLPGLINHTRAQQMETEFATLAQMLQKPEAKTDATTTNWTVVKSSINTLSKLLTPSLPEAPEAEMSSSDS